MMKIKGSLLMSTIITPNGLNLHDFAYFDVSYVKIC